MGRRLGVDLFCEDAGHELVVRALVERLAAELGLEAADLRPRSARGGHGRAVTELGEWLRWAGGAGRVEERGDVLVAMVDANSDGWAARRKDLAEVTDGAPYPGIALCIPDPHVEVWCGADPDALRRVLEVELPPPPSAGRARYKKWLRTAVESAGHLVLGDPMEVALDLIPVMDLYRAGKACPSLRHAIEEMRDALSAGARSV